MHRPTLSKLSRRGFALGVVASVAACGRRQTVVVPSTSGRIAPQRFDDVKPVVWSGQAPQSYPVHGIDVSRWQGAIDWRQARANGVNFAFLKATEGGDHLDPLFRAHWDGARAAGVPVGAYHFYYHCRPAAEQARWFIRNVPRAAGALPPVLDIEWTPFSPTCTDRPPAAEVRAEAANFLRIVEAHYGQAAIIYSTPDFWTRNEMWKLPGKHEFWLRSVTQHPSDRYAGQHWTFWQYSGTGTLPGVSGKADLNVFAGSEASWVRWLAARTL